MKKRREPIFDNEQIILTIWHELKKRTEAEETVGKIHTSRSLWQYLTDLMDEKERNLTFREVLRDQRRKKGENKNDHI